MTLPAVPGIRRHIVSLDWGQIRYRRTIGDGPVTFLLHRAPRSSEDLLPILTRWPKDMTLVAIDIPGYGGSDAMPGASPAIADYARAIWAFADAIGARRFNIYGEQFGAHIALRMAIEQPERVTAVAAIEPLLLDRAETDDMRDALTPFEPSWDGTQFGWLWSYLREETAFSPWSSRSAATRIFGGMPSAEAIHQRAIQFVRADSNGSGWAKGIAAALDDAPATALAQCSVPLLTGGLEAHRFERRFAEHTPHQPARIFTGQPDLYDAAQTFLGSHPGDPLPPAPATKPIAGRLWSDFVDVPGGQLHVMRNHDAETVPLLVQHDAASSVHTVASIARGLVGRRTLFVFDMPGSGDSDLTIPEEGASLLDYSEAVRQALTTLGLDTIDFYGMWGGGFVGVELALRYPKQVRRLVASNIFFHEGEELRQMQANYTPSVTPEWHGGHLARCWHQMRDQGLFYPWFDRTDKGTLRREPFIDPAMVHERVCSLLKAGNMYRTAYQAHFVYPILESLSRLQVPTLLCTADWDPNRPHTEAAAAASPNCSFALLTPDLSRWGNDFLSFLEASG